MQLKTKKIAATFVFWWSSNCVIDSGATCHICSDRTEFENLYTNCLDKVTVANGNLVVSSGKGVCC